MPPDGPLPTTPPDRCGKKRFTEAAARKALAAALKALAAALKARVLHGDTRRREQRMYPRATCNAWHLTSKPAR